MPDRQSCTHSSLRPPASVRSSIPLLDCQYMPLINYYTLSPATRQGASAHVLHAPINCIKGVSPSTHHPSRSPSQAPRRPEWGSPSCPPRSAHRGRAHQCPAPQGCPGIAPAACPGRASGSPKHDQPPRQHASSSLLIARLIFAWDPGGCLLFQLEDQETMPLLCLLNIQ